MHSTSLVELYRDFQKPKSFSLGNLVLRIKACYQGCKFNDTAMHLMMTCGAYGHSQKKYPATRVETVEFLFI